MKTNSISAVVMPFVLAFAILFVIPADHGIADEIPRSISVNGTGEVKAQPTLVHISVGVLSQATTAREALDQNNEAMKRVIEELTANNIEKRDIQTASFSVSPRRQSYKRGDPPKIIGYTVQNRVRITLREVKSLGKILDKIVSTGSNQIDSIVFSVDNPAELLDQARVLAVKDAKRKAEIYANASGVKLGDVLSVQEGIHAAPQVRIANRSASFSSAESVPIEAGEQTLRVKVNIMWGIDD